jgi:monoamine oxidase
VLTNPNPPLQLRDGQTAWARAVFHDALSTQKLSYTFTSPVSSISDGNSIVSVTTSTGPTFEAAKVIVTTPLNVTNNIKFSPPLSKVRKEAFDVGSVAFAHKIHCVMSKPALRGKAWSAYDTRDPVGIASPVGVDYTHDKKSSIIVAFGAFPLLSILFRLS